MVSLNLPQKVGKNSTGNRALSVVAMSVVHGGVASVGSLVVVGKCLH